MNVMANSMTRVSSVEEKRDEEMGALVLRKESGRYSGGGDRREGSDDSGIGGGRKEEEGPSIMEKEEKEVEEQQGEDEVDWMGVEIMECNQPEGGHKEEVNNRKMAKQSPKKKKKTAGKEWKRRAREVKGPEKGEGSSIDNKREGKRKGGQDIDLEILPPKAKIARVEHGNLINDDITAKAAMQPHRSQ